MQQLDRRRRSVAEIWIVIAAGGSDRQAQTWADACTGGKDRMPHGIRKLRWARRSIGTSDSHPQSTFNPTDRIHGPPHV
jgi:hypothetical protein